MRFAVTVCTAVTAICLCLAANTALAARYVSVKKDGVNLRAKPSTQSEILWELFKGFPLKVLETKGKWAKTVDFEGDKGWIYRPLLADKKTVIVKVGTANMRIGPGKAYEVVATVKYGVVFTPVDREGDWVKVRHADGATGWIHKNLLWPSD